MHLKINESNICLYVMWIYFFISQGEFLQLGQRLSPLEMIQQSTLQNILQHFQHSLGQSRGIQQQTGQVMSQFLRKLQLAIHFSSIVTNSGQLHYYTYCEYIFYDASSIYFYNLTNQDQYLISIYIFNFNLMKQEGQKSSIQRLKAQSSQNDVSAFIRSYELKQKAVKQLVEIYCKHILSEYFTTTFKSAIALIVLPSLTNIYYAIRSHTILAGIMPFAVPLICFTNYIYSFNKEMQQFSLTNHADAELARNQYEIIYQFSYFSRDMESYMTKLQNYREAEKKKIDQII